MTGRKCFAGGVEREGQRFARNARHERTDEPSEERRDASSERYRLALDVRAAVPFQKSPIRVKPPEISTVLSGRQLVFFWSIRICHFRDPKAVDTALRPIWARIGELRLILRIDNDRDDFFHVEAEVDTERLTSSRDEFRTRNRWPENLGVTVVIL